MIVLSFAQSRPVYEEDLPADEFALFEEVPEIQLVFDATFSGVQRSLRTGRLITTYDRSQPKGRQACPT
jgi:hypothetical protein